MTLYDGPIFDAHHHLWDYSADAYPWLAGNDNASIAHGFCAADYRTAAGDLDIVGSVWIEALAADPWAEAMAAAQVHEQTPWLCNAIVGHLPLDAADVGGRIDALGAAVPGLRGIRDIVAVRPGAASLARRPDLLTLPNFEVGLRAVAERGLVFDLMLEPWQMGDALRLAGALPKLSIVIEHAGSPDFSSPDGTALWRDAMRTASELDNVSVKISALHCRMPDWTDDRLAEPIRALISWFGSDRLAFASDFPTHDRSCPFARAYATFARATSALSATEQRALFHDTARRLYRI